MLMSVGAFEPGRRRPFSAIAIVGSAAPATGTPTEITTPSSANPEGSGGWAPNVIDVDSRIGAPAASAKCSPTVRNVPLTSLAVRYSGTVNSVRVSGADVANETETPTST